MRSGWLVFLGKFVLFLVVVVLGDVGNGMIKEGSGLYCVRNW